MRERVDHHADTTVGELLDLVLLLHREGTGGDRAVVPHAADEVDRRRHVAVGQVGLTVLQHRSSRRPYPRHHVVLHAVRRFEGERQNPARDIAAEGRDLRCRIRELRTGGRRGGYARIGQEGVVREHRVDEVHDRDHVGAAVDLDLARQFAVVVVVLLHQRGEVGDDALRGEVVDPRAVQADDVRHGAGCGSCEQLLLGRCVRSAHELDRDARVGVFELVDERPELTVGELGLPPLRELDGDVFAIGSIGAAVARRATCHGQDCHGCGRCTGELQNASPSPHCDHHFSSSRSCRTRASMLVRAVLSNVMPTFAGTSSTCRRVLQHVTTDLMTVALFSRRSRSRSAPSLGCRYLPKSAASSAHMC